MAGKKEPLHYGKLILIGFIWTLVYLQVMAVACFFLFDFNVLSLSDWAGRFRDFLRSKWVIDTVVDFGLFSCMILFIPLWGVGWWGLYKIHWKKLIPRRFVEKKFKPSSTKVAATKKGFMPHKLRVQSSALLSVPAIPPVQQSSSSSSSATDIRYPAGAYPQPYPNGGEESSVGDVWTDNPEESSDIQAIFPLTANTPAEFYPHIFVGNHRASFALSTDNRAIVVRLINHPDSSWVVDTEAPLAESDWYCESHVLKTPVTDVVEIAKSLQESESDSVIIPVILMMSGTLLNPVEARDYLKKNKVILLRLEDMESIDIPLFTDFLDEYFGTKVPPSNRG